MTDVTASPQAFRPSATGWMFALAIFSSAALVFAVQPMMGRLITPTLGGSPSVWNTSMVFFQAALLVGYGYAHLLQRVGSIRVQVGIHLGLLLLALASFWPLRVNEMLGAPDTAAPIPWLIGTLALSVGAPFAVLSATAPLLQAWFARVRQGTEEGQNPYVLYAASNLGSFAALIAYPGVIEPLLGLSAQTITWSAGYGVFILMIVALAFVVWRSRLTEAEPAPLEKSAPITWKERAIWVLIAAAPSSLMLGVTTHLSVDVASAPFLWVVPLALYLLTFVIAFQPKPAVPFEVTLMVQAATAAACTALLPAANGEWLMLFGIHLTTFFFCALMCHQILARRRPAPDRLTEFYLLLSLGGVLGGAFNALIAPVIFDLVIEYPMVLCLVALARPWSKSPTTRAEWAIFAVIPVLCLIPPILFGWLEADGRPHTMGFSYDQGRIVSHLVLGAAAICAFLIRDKVRIFFLALVMIAVSAHQVALRYEWVESDRSFFGVLRIGEETYPEVGTVRILMHGTTLHGAQSQEPAYACRPTLYYADTTPIGQAAVAIQNRTPSANIGVVGLGSGAMAAYKRESDNLTFFEIDPMVDRWARDPERFSFIANCASGPVRTVLGDARLTLRNEPANSYDLLIIDAFSSDAVPTHLLTVEAIGEYLRVLKPDGVLVLHLSNRNLEITTPAIAAAQALNVPVMHQIYGENPDAPQMMESSTEAIVISRTPEGLAMFEADPRWNGNIQSRSDAWTDDYVNLFGALMRQVQLEY